MNTEVFLGLMSGCRCSSLGMGRDPYTVYSIPFCLQVLSPFVPFLPATVYLRLVPMGKWELGSTCSRTAPGGPGIMFIGLGFIQGTGMPWRNFAKG